MIVFVCVLVLNNLITVHHLYSTAYYTYTRYSHWTWTLCKWALCILTLRLMPAPGAQGLRREDKKWFPDLDINSYPILPSYAPEYYYSHLR